MQQSNFTKSRQSILALIQQCIIFIVLFHIYTYRPFEKYDDDNDHHHHYEFQKNNSETSLAILNEFKCKISQKYLSGVVIDDRFLVQELIGDGYTGSVRSAVDLKTGEDVAIKFAEKYRHFSLEKEYVNYLYLGADEPDVVQHGIPHIIHYGDFCEYKVLVMTKAGQDLYELVYETVDGYFTFSTICKIALQAIRILEYVHSKGLVFHDVKPSNIAIGLTNPNQIIFFDFAFSEFYVNAMGESKAREEAPDINGTPEYMGRGPLNRYTHVRKDDFISLGLVLLELNGVELPWMNVTSENDDIYKTMDIVLETWDEYGIDEICNESENPDFFIDYFNYFDTLESYEQPDYDQLLEFFEEQLTPEELESDSLGIILKERRNIFDEFDFDFDFDDDDDVNDDNDNTVTSLAVINDFKWKIPEKYIYGIVIDDRFIVGEQLGDGHTGFVRSAIDIETGNKVAIKFAPEKTFEFLEKEFVNYLYLSADEPDIVQYGIPHLVHFGDFEGYKILVMTKTGPSLYDLQVQAKDKKLDLEIICKIAIQSIRILEFIHSKGLVFHDVKPENIAIGDANANQIFFVDFDFSEFYVNALGEFKEREEASNFSGTTEYMAWGPLNRFTHVRIDDLISLGLVLLQLNGVYIPWMYNTNDDDDIVLVMDAVLEGWNEYGIDRIIDESDDPQLFSQYFDYCDSIESHEKPDYDRLTELFSSHITDKDLHVLFDD